MMKSKNNSPKNDLANEILADYLKNGWRYGVTF